MSKAIWFTLGFFCALMVSIALIAGPLSKTTARSVLSASLPIPKILPTQAPAAASTPVTAPTPLPSVGLSWQRAGGYISVCQSLHISDQRTAHFAPCDEGKRLALLSISERQQFEEAVQRYMPFTYQARQDITGQGQFSLSLQFGGHGTTKPTETEQETLAQWATDLYERLEAEEKRADLVAQARLELAIRENVIVDDIDTVAVEPKIWPDACLGLGETGLFCAQVVTPGYQVMLQVNGQIYVYRTDLDTQIRYQSETS